MGQATFADLSFGSAKTTANDESGKNGEPDEAEQHDGQGPPPARDGEVPHQAHQPNGKNKTDQPDDNSRDRAAFRSGHRSK